MAKVNNTIDLLEAGIRAEALRQKLIANNVANLETPNYRRYDIKFEELLSKAMDSGQISPEDLEPQIIQPMNTPLDNKGNDASREHEVGEMVKNSLRHKAFVSLLKKKYQQITLAINVK